MSLSGEYATEKVAWVADQLRIIDETGTTKSVNINGAPVAVFTVRGAKSGLLRRVPLMRVESDGCYAMVASKGGHSDNPLWYYNVKANPYVDILDGSAIMSGAVRELSGDERQLWWNRAVAVYPDYADYQQKTDRLIPIFLVEPLPS